MKVMVSGTECVKELESDVLLRATRDEQHAFVQMFRRYERPLRSFLYGMTGRRGSVDDLIQETLSRAFQFLPGLRDETKISTWIFGIARNVALESCRQRYWNLKQIEWDHQEVQTLCDSNTNPESDAINNELYEAVSRGFNLLDEDLRTVLTLRVFAEKKYSEIAEITGWSLSKVKVEIYRARLKMRKILAPHLERK
jgi:RNA polymerase sigma-70 factor (ECF subfamily)